MFRDSLASLAASLTVLAGLGAMAAILTIAAAGASTSRLHDGDPRLAALGVFAQRLLC